MSDKGDAKKSKIIDYGAETDAYIWDQEYDSVTVKVKCEKELRGRDVIVQFDKQSVRVALKESADAPLIEGKLGGKILVDESVWTISDGVLELELAKLRTEHGWWPYFIEGGPEIDMELIEGSKYLDDSLLAQIKEKKRVEREQKENAEQGESEST
jgi:CS domain